jgi:hypothetical protein
LGRLLSGHEVRTVSEVGWTGMRNGELLMLAATTFDVFLTADQNIQHQQNLSALPMAVVVIVAPMNRIEDLQPLVPALLRALATLAPRQLIHVSG